MKPKKVVDFFNEQLDEQRLIVKIAIDCIQNMGPHKKIELRSVICAKKDQTTEKLYLNNM